MPYHVPAKINRTESGRGTLSKAASNIAKAIAIMMMLMHHLFSTRSRIAANGHGQDVSFYPFDAGQVLVFSQCLKACVAVFVFITAYGIYKSITAKHDPEKGDAGFAGVAMRYSCGHVVKLLINFWAVYIPFALLGFAVSDHTVLTVYGGEGVFNGFLYFLIDFMGLADMFGTPTLNDTWWYMSLAILLIFLLPACTLLARKVGGVVLFGIVLILPPIAGFDTISSVWTYLPTAACGMAFAQYDLFSKLDFGAKKPWHYALLFVVCAVLMLAVIRARRIDELVFALNVVGACLICQMARILEKVPGLSAALQFLGRHSMNIFLLHTFIYSYYFGRFIYSFGHFLLIFAVLLAASLLCSIVLEQLKRLIGYNRLRDRAVASVEQAIRG